MPFHLSSRAGSPFLQHPTRAVVMSVTHTTVHLHISTFQAVVLGVLQGLSELFPVSSLGHTVLFPTLFGWHSVVAAQSDPESSWLAFVVMLHVGSALGLLAYFWRDWVAIIRAWFRKSAPAGEFGPKTP